MSSVTAFHHRSVPKDWDPTCGYSRAYLRRKYLFDQQEGLCFYCKVPMTMHDDYSDYDKIPKTACTIEHIIDWTEVRMNPGVDLKPKQKVVGACRKCNDSRGRSRSDAYELARGYKKTFRFGIGKLRFVFIIAFKRKKIDFSKIPP